MRICGLLLMLVPVVSIAAEDPGYNPIGRRDPFQPALESTKPATGKTLLERVELSEILLEGVLSGISDPRATVTVAGESFLVKNGTPVGKYGGRVVRISSSEIVVREQSTNLDGVTHVKDTSIALPGER